MKGWVAGLVLVGFCAAPHAQNASPPVRIVVGLTAGGPMDTWARMIAEPLSEALRQAVVVENKPGAEGLLAAEAVRAGPADGSTLLGAGFGTMVGAPLAQPKVPFDPSRDFTPIALFGRVTMALFVHSDLPAHSLSELIAALRASPGTVNYATASALDKLLYLQVMQSAGTSMTQVQYKGAAHLIPDLVAGRVQASIMPLAAGLAHAKDGRLRVLATFAPARSALAPEVPTNAEAGMPEVSSPGWIGLFGPGPMAAASVERISQAVAAALKSAELRQRLERQALQPATLTPQEFRALVRHDFDAWKQVLASSELPGAR